MSLEISYLLKTLRKVYFFHWTALLFIWFTLIFLLASITNSWVLGAQYAIVGLPAFFITWCVHNRTMSKIKKPEVEKGSRVIAYNN